MKKKENNLSLPRFRCLSGCNRMDTQTMGNVLQFLDRFSFGFVEVWHRYTFLLENFLIGTFNLKSDTLHTGQRNSIPSCCSSKNRLFHVIILYERECIISSVAGMFIQSEGFFYYFESVLCILIKVEEVQKTCRELMAHQTFIFMVDTLSRLSQRPVSFYNLISLTIKL